MDDQDDRIKGGLGPRCRDRGSRFEALTSSRSEKIRSASSGISGRLFSCDHMNPNNMDWPAGPLNECFQHADSLDALRGEHCLPTGQGTVGHGQSTVDLSSLNRGGAPHLSSCPCWSLQNSGNIKGQNGSVNTCCDEHLTLDASSKLRTNTSCNCPRGSRPTHVQGVQPLTVQRFGQRRVQLEAGRA